MDKFKKVYLVAAKRLLVLGRGANVIVDRPIIKSRANRREMMTEDESIQPNRRMGVD